VQEEGKLLLMLGWLVNQGKSVLVIEHNLEVIKTSDWIVDMRPEGGSRGGMVVAEARPWTSRRHGSHRRLPQGAARRRLRAAAGAHRRGRKTTRQEDGEQDGQGGGREDNQATSPEDGEEGRTEEVVPSATTDPGRENARGPSSSWPLSRLEGHPVCCFVPQ
jgi:hypothetical protein